MSSDGEDQSVEALQRRKNRRVAAYEQEKIALQHQMTAIQKQMKQKRIDKAKASKHERLRIQREFRVCLQWRTGGSFVTVPSVC